jgi:tRNA (guanine-N7-)-methyltransferase
MGMSGREVIPDYSLFYNYQNIFYSCIKLPLFYKVPDAGTQVAVKKVKKGEFFVLRQRKLKNIEARIAEHSEYLVDDPAGKKGEWQQLFENDNPVYAEFGSGKGKFIMKMAELYPDRNFIAIECRESIVLRVLEKAEELNLSNIAVVLEHILDVNEYFEEHELAGVYLNFSDPWPKSRHAKRRLTSSNYLEGYQKILKPGGCIEFKTDNDGLFEFTVMQFQKTSMEVIDFTDDLHNSDLDARLVTTEYEDRFHGGGKNIHYCRMRALK